MIYIVRINNTEYEVEVEQGKAEIVSTQAITQPSITAPSANTTSIIKPISTAITGGEPINAPMPGSILDIKVKIGDMVKNGQILAVLEAMKMENEILAPRDGCIKDLIVTKGASVATGDVLLTLE